MLAHVVEERQTVTRRQSRVRLGVAPETAPARATPGLAALLTAGNQATARVLAPGMGERVLQRANLRWTMGTPPVIDDIDFGPRSGVQEDHATAVAAFKLAVVRNLKGRTLLDAIVQLYLLANEITELPGYGDYRTIGLANKVDQLKRELLTLHEVAGGNQLYAAGELGRLIDDYLRIRNLVPGTKHLKGDVTRPTGYKGGGGAEKEGKRELSQALDTMATDTAISADRVESLLISAMTKLHDYITTRKTLPTQDELAKVAAQHFHSIMQVSPLLTPFATQIFHAWVQRVIGTWASVVALDPAAFTLAVFRYSTMAFPEVGPTAADRPARREDVWNKTDKGYLPVGWDDASATPEATDVLGVAYTVHDSRAIARYQRIALLNRAAEQGLIAAARAIQYIIEHPAEQDELLDNLGFDLIELANGRVYLRLRGG